MMSLSLWGKNPTNQQACRTHDNGIKNRRRLWGY